MTNVAVVVLDTLRKDKFDAHFDWLPGIRFDNAWAPSHYTVPVHASLFTGKYPSEAGVHAKSERLDCSDPVLAERLREQGYTTRALSENLLLSSLNDFDRGFESFRSIGRAVQINSNIFNWSKALRDIPQNGVLRDARAVLRCFFGDADTVPSLEVGWKMKQNSFDGLSEAETRIQETDFGTDEFLFVNLMQAHGPYNPPESYATVECDRYAPKGAETLLGGDVDFSRQKRAYDDCVRYLSDGYQGLFVDLREDFDYVVTLADHGELFGEHGARQHWHGVYPELTHVPIVISGDGIDDERRDETVSVLDVHETVQHLVGIDAPSRGQNLLGDVESRPCLVEYRGLRESRREILAERGFSEVEIDEYDVRLNAIAVPSDYYGFETVEGFEEQGTARVDDPRSRMDELSKSVPERSVADETKAVSDDVKEQLERLGYA
ncbi:sulfatase-like hydrolase/transferase [Halobacterium sp. MBLA0001]|uniref:sulfatase-like hydrolase/transferase n=1 Tax=Halobacterium sp. MBLA0001 TaxID=3413511 RepID=UPI003C72496C